MKVGKWRNRAVRPIPAEWRSSCVRQVCKNGVAFSGDVGVSFNLKAGLIGGVCNQAGT